MDVHQRYIALCFLMLYWILPSVGQAANADGNRRFILLISSYSPQKEEGVQMLSSFTERFGENSDMRMSVEYMDCESSPSFQSWAEWMRYLFDAYSTRPELVVLFGNEGWSTYRATCPESWRSIPVVLGAVKKAFLDYENGFSDLEGVNDLPEVTESFSGFHVTGYYYKDYIEENVTLIKRLQPWVDKIAFSHDNRYSIPFYKDYLDNIVHVREDMRFCYLSGDRLSTAHLLDTLSRMDDSYALLSAGWYTDVNHYPHAYSMLRNELPRYTSKCFYLVTDQGFSNNDYLGGYFVSGQDLGHDLADLAYGVLTKGITVKPAFGITPSGPHLHVNYPVLEKMGIDKRLLSDDVIYHNRPLSMWEEHPMEVILIILLMLSMLAIFLLILYFRKRREDSYRVTNEWMMRLIGSMPDMAVIYNSDLEVTQVVNPRDDVLLGLEMDRLVGMSVRDLSKYNDAFRVGGTVIAKNVCRTAHTGEVCTFSYEVPYEGKTWYTRGHAVPFGKDSVICFTHDITQQVEAEKEIRRLQVFLQTVVDNLPIGVFVKNVADDYRYLFYNDKMAEFYGEENICQIGKNDFEVDDPYAEAYRKEDELVIKGDKPLSFDRVVCDPATGLAFRWGVTTKTRLVNDDGSCYIIAVVTDTTEIRRKEFELENIRKELSIALDAGSMSAWIYDVDKRYFNSLYNDTVAGLGITFEQGYEMAHPDDRGKYDHFMRILSSGEKDKLQEIFRFNRGEGYNWYETHAIALKSGKDQHVYQIIGTEKNITEELARQRELEESKSKLEMAFESAQIVPWEYTANEDRLYSLTPGVLENEGISLYGYLRYMCPDDVRSFVGGMEDMVKGRRRSMNLQVRMDFTGEVMRWYEFHGMVSEHDANGNVSRLIGLRRDITDMKMTDELIELRNKAEEANRLKTAFLANMSHEIRTPLNAIVGFSNLIAEAESKEEVEEYNRIIGINNELLLRLINDILDLSKIEAGQMDFRFTTFDLAEVFDNLYQVFKERVKEGVCVGLDLPDESCVIHSEKNRLTQVLSNFLGNACKFTSKGAIRMGYTRMEGNLRFFVEDTGKGIAPENIPLVFNRFSKFDSFVQGTGLGLSICESIVRYLGGEIGVYSELGKGSEFWFTLPCDPENNS